MMCIMHACPHFPPSVLFRDEAVSFESSHVCVARERPNKGHIVRVALRLPKCAAAACDYLAEAALSRPRRAWTSGQLSSLFGHLALSSSLSVPSIHPITCLSSGGGDCVHEQASSARSCLAKTRQARQVNTARGSRCHESAHQRFHAVYVFVCVCACRGGNRSGCARPFCFREEGYLSYPLATFARQALFPSHCFMQTRNRCTGRVA